MQLLIASIIAEIWKIHSVGFYVLGIVVNCKTLGMPASVGVHKLFFFGWRKMANFKNDIDMIGRDWRRISWIGYLADKAAVLGESNGETLPRSGRSLVKHAGQNAFILGNCLT